MLRVVYYFNATELHADEWLKCKLLRYPWASLVVQTVKNMPAMWEAQVRSLGQEDPLEKGMATCSSVRIWRIQQTEEPGRHSPLGHRESDRTERLTLSLLFMLRMFHHNLKEKKPAALNREDKSQ